MPTRFKVEIEMATFRPLLTPVWGDIRAHNLRPDGPHLLHGSRP